MLCINGRVVLRARSRSLRALMPHGGYPDAYVWMIDAKLPLVQPMVITSAAKLANQATIQQLSCHVIKAGTIHANLIDILRYDRDKEEVFTV
jgi:hypothetical protein